MPLDIQIIRHPLLSSLMTDEDSPVPPDFYEESLLENELEAFGGAPVEVTTEQRIASIRRKEALLRKKKELLKHLIKKLRDLIIQSNQLTEVQDQMTSPQRLVPQIQPSSTQLENSNFPPKLQYGNEDGPKVRPWWDRIMSNRH